MKLSPKKILETKFDAVINGYSPTKVDQFLDLIIDDYKELIQENLQLKEKINILEAKIEKLEHLILKQESEKQELTNNEVSEINDENNFELKE